MLVEPNIDFSVVIVTYNNQTVIASCLNSLLLELHDFTFQILVIDNNSSDRTKKIVKQICIQCKSKDGELILIENKSNLGFTKAINQGLKICKGQYILTLNPDTEFKSASLIILKEVLQEDTKIGVVAPQLLYPDGTIQPSCRRFPRHRDVLFEIMCLSYIFRNSKIFNGWKMGDFDHQNSQKVDQPQGACLLFRQQVLKSVGYWDEKFPMFFSDVDWCRRVKNQGWEILFEPKAKVIHHRGVSILQRKPNMIWSSHHSFYKYFKKHNTDFKSFFLNEIFGGILFFSALIRILSAHLSALILKKQAN